MTEPIFTAEDVAKLKAMPDNVGYTGYASIDDGEWFASLIARIVALVPPNATDAAALPVEGPDVGKP